jgi:hypothetical protein
VTSIAACFKINGLRRSAEAAISEPPTGLEPISRSDVRVRHHLVHEAHDRCPRVRFWPPPPW